MAVKPRRSGQSTFGSDRVQSNIAVKSKTGKPSGIVLVDSAGVEYFLYVDTSGNLVISNVEAKFTTTPNTVGGALATGIKVGAQ